MFVPKNKKRYHIPTVISRKSANGFIEHGLRTIAAKPHRYFHQTLTFPAAITDAKSAKKIFTKFIKGVLKFYGKHDMAAIYFQERRKADSSIHFHVCFLFFNGDNLPVCPSRMRREFRTDIFKRWNGLLDGKVVHKANALTEHEYNQDSMLYFARALVVDDTTKRGATNWWGGFNNQLILNRSAPPTKQQRKAVFDLFFRKSKRRAASNVPDRAAVNADNPPVEAAQSVTF